MDVFTCFKYPTQKLYYCKNVLFEVFSTKFANFIELLGASAGTDTLSLHVRLGICIRVLVLVG